VMDAVGTPSSVLVVGGTSDIGLAVVERLGTGTSLRVVLAARPSPRRDAAVQRLTGGGHEVTAVDFDAEDTASHAGTVSRAFAGGDLDVVVVAVGLLGDQEQAWQDASAAVRLLQVNATAAVSTGVLVAERLRSQGHGTVVALSSVAAERARRSNFVYGAGKAAMDAFFTGLREALRPDGVRVLVVRPGFVRSRMTEGLPAVPLSTTPEVVAEHVARALVARREVVRVPATFTPVMAVLRSLPSPVFRRLPF
jgi:decaprenylphospho-beta-D-erythro-pentofuranosid-2-ulose 2-reductase